MPKRGDIAVCSLGHVGIITEASAKSVTYPDGTNGTAFIGLKVWPLEEFGRPWSSRNPKVLVSAPEPDL